MTPESTSILLPFLAPFFYLGSLWCIARLTGWRSLSRSFPMSGSPGPLLGRLWRGSLQLGPFGHYRHSVVFSVHAEGLRLAPWFHLRFGHAPAFLPWEELTFVHRPRLGLLEGIDVLTRSGRRLWLPLSQAQALRTLSQGRFWPTAPQGPGSTASSAPRPASGMPELLRRA